MARSKAVSLTEGNITRLILQFSWPVFVSMIFSEFYNITNSLIVGNYVSLKALSAVSACTWICNIFNFAFYGIGMGAGILVARYYGAKDYKMLKKSLDTSIVFAFAGGLLLTVLAELFLPAIMHLSNIAPDIYDDAISYMRVYFLGNTAVLTYQMCFFILRSFGDTRHQLYYSIVSSVTNIILGLIFVRVLHMSIIGTALATILSQFLMDVLALNLMFHYEGINFSLKNIDFSFDVIKQICALGIPAGLQNSLIAVSSLLVQAYINKFPNVIISGIGVGEKIFGWGQLPSMSISSATMSLVAQNMGNKNYERVQKSISESVKLSTIFTVILGVIIFVSAPLLVSRFSDNTDVWYYGTEMIRYSIGSMLLLSMSHVLNAANRGAGNVRAPMYIAIFGQVICKYLFVAIGISLWNDVHILYLSSAVGYSVAGILATVYFYKSKWVLEHQLRKQ